MEYTLPEQFEEFADARKAGFLRVKGLKEQGGKVAGVFCTFTPTEILDAAGFVSVSLCGSSCGFLLSGGVDHCAVLTFGATGEVVGVANMICCEAERGECVVVICLVSADRNIIDVQVFLMGGIVSACQG